MKRFSRSCPKSRARSSRSIRTTARLSPSRAVSTTTPRSTTASSRHGASPVFVQALHLFRGARGGTHACDVVLDAPVVYEAPDPVVGIGQNPVHRGRGAGCRGLAAGERLAALLRADAASRRARTLAQPRHDPRHAPDRRRLHARVRPALRPAEGAHSGRPDRRARYGTADPARDGGRLRGFRKRRLPREAAHHRPHSRRRRQRDRGNRRDSRLCRLRAGAAGIHGRPAGGHSGQQRGGHRARCGCRRGIARADTRGSCAARHLGSECLDHHGPAARRGPPRHGPACARARPRRHRRQDRND